MAEVSTTNVMLYNLTGLTEEEFAVLKVALSVVTVPKLHQSFPNSSLTKAQINEILTQLYEEIA